MKGEWATSTRQGGRELGALIARHLFSLVVEPRVDVRTRERDAVYRLSDGNWVRVAFYSGSRGTSLNVESASRDSGWSRIGPQGKETGDVRVILESLDGQRRTVEAFGSVNAGLCRAALKREAIITVMAFAGLHSLMGRGPVSREVCARCARSIRSTNDSSERRQGPATAPSSASVHKRRATLAQDERSSPSPDPGGPGAGHNPALDSRSTIRGPFVLAEAQMTLLKPGMTARYTLPDGSVYEVTVEAQPDDESEKE